MVALIREVKNERHFKHLAPKVIAVAYEAWSFTRKSKYSDLHGKLLASWETGRRGEVAGYERCSTVLPIRRDHSLFLLIVFFQKTMM